jgi:ABC-type transporter Mla maintaining outer membrane lipid asymmetry ATPase subunit MlaF
MTNNADSETVVDLENVSFLFKQHRALDGVAFQVEPRSLHGFVGPNGAGKTTTLKLICTLLKPQTGRIRVFGHDVRDDVKAIRRRIGYMPDHFSMYRQMTVFEYLDFFGAAYGFSLKDRNRIVGDVLALTDMEGRKDDLIQGLSRGTIHPGQGARGVSSTQAWVPEEGHHPPRMPDGCDPSRVPKGCDPLGCQKRGTIHPGQGARGVPSTHTRVPEEGHHLPSVP